jgi:hypothetical protein
MRTGCETARAWCGASAHDPSAEDQSGFARPTDVQVAADDLLEEDPPDDRLVQHLGEGELRLQHRGPSYRNPAAVSSAVNGHDSSPSASRRRVMAHTRTFLCARPMNTTPALGDAGLQDGRVLGRVKHVVPNFPTCPSIIWVSEADEFLVAHIEPNEVGNRQNDIMDGYRIKVAVHED